MEVLCEEMELSVAHLRINVTINADNQCNLVIVSNA